MIVLKMHGHQMHLSWLDPAPPLKIYVLGGEKTHLCNSFYLYRTKSQETEKNTKNGPMSKSTKYNAWNDRRSLDQKQVKGMHLDRDGFHFLPHFGFYFDPLLTKRAFYSQKTPSKYILEREHVSRIRHYKVMVFLFKLIFNRSSSHSQWEQ